MCRKLCFLICFAVVASLIVSDFAGASVVSNGGFEEGTWTSESSVPDGWWKWSDSWGWASWKNNSANAHSGSKFICLGGNNSSQYADFGQDASDIRPGTVYEFEAWAKTEVWGSPTAKLKVEFKNSSNQAIRTDELTLFTGQQSSWQKYTLTTDPAPEGTVSANFICEGIGQGSVWFDDISVELIPVTDDPGLLNNTGFEGGVWNSEFDWPDGWWKWTSGGWGTWKNDYSEAHNGNKFVCLGGNDSNQYADFGQDVLDMKVGASYKLEAWVKTETWGSPTARLKVEFKNSGNQVIRTDELTLFTNQQSNWQKYALTTAPAPAGSVSANFICEGAGQGSVYFDDIYAILAPVTDGPDVLVNGSFEEGTWTAGTDTPDDWWKWSGHWGWASWRNDADYALDGSKFLSMGGNDYSEYAVFGQDVPNIIPIRSYVFSVWVRAESMWWGWPTAKLKVEFKNSSDDVLRTDELNLFSGRNTNWNWYNLVTAPAPAETTNANFICYAEGEATMWFDKAKATLYVPDIAKNPSPRSEETNIDKNTVLSWVAGDYAVSHNVYFGTNFNDVNNANTSSAEYKGEQSFGDDVYDPNMVLELGETYYWRIDEVDDSNAASPWKGDVWSFTVTNLDVVEVSDSSSYQTIDGFGASFTESSAYLMATGMTSAQYLAAMDALFDCNDGIGLSYLRQPIGTSDFRILNDYTYDDIPNGQTDYDLSNFSIACDEDYVIPILQDALAINPDISILSSPWSAPAWMKDSSALNYGSLIDSNEIYETYADYFVKYVQAYNACGIPIDAVTLQNEPGAVIYTYPGMEMTSGELAKLVKILGPKFEANSIDTKIVTYDWNWNNTDYPIEVLDDNEANPWIAGTAFHAYEGTYQKQSVVKNAYPDKDIYFTEYTAVLDGDFEDDLVRLTSDFIIGSVRNWSRCIVLWNMALDETGGPKIDGGCGNCRGVITVDSSTGEVTKNAEYYVLGHASKFVRPEAVRVGSSEPAEKVSSVAFRNPDNSIVVVVLNANKNSRDFKMEWQGESFSYTLPGRSVITFTWPNELNATISVWMTTGDKSKLLAQQANLQFTDDSTATVIHLNVPYSEKQQDNYSGTACLKMALDYEATNSYTQTELHNYGVAHNSAANQSSSYIDPQGMYLAMNNYELNSNYNYASLSSTTLNNAYHNICHWIAYCVPSANPENMPTMIPTGGNYENWVIVNGFRASDDPWSASNYTVYGFWITDPYTSGIGQNSYKTAAALADNFSALSTSDSWNGKYVSVCEPPEHQAQVTIADLVAYKTKLSSKQDIINAAIEGLKNNLLIFDKKSKDSYAGSHPGRPMRVRSDSGNYFIVPFVKNDGCSVAVIIDAKNGAFRQASYSGTPDVKYLKRFEKTKAPKMNKVKSRNKNDFLPSADKVDFLSD